MGSIFTAINITSKLIIAINQIIKKSERIQNYKQINSEEGIRYCIKTRICKRRSNTKNKCIERKIFQEAYLQLFKRKRHELQL